jgi:hypothetical protein
MDPPGLMNVTSLATALGMQVSLLVGYDAALGTATLSVSPWPGALGLSTEELLGQLAAAPTSSGIVVTNVTRLSSTLVFVPMANRPANTHGGSRGECVGCGPRSCPAVGTAQWRSLITST